MKYIPLEKLTVGRPVDRLEYVSQLCKNKKVLDIGCYDETALKAKENTEYWLHGLILKEAKSAVGIDSSDLIKGEIKTGENSLILRLDLFDLDEKFVKKYPVDIIIAGELIEHIENVQTFIKELKNLYPNRKLILTTPNATSITNVLLAFSKRESNHQDHLHMFSFKTLNTVCLRSNIKKYTIRPYHVSYGEMYLNSKGIKRIIVKIIEKGINLVEYIFPMLSGGYIVEIQLR